MFMLDENEVLLLNIIPAQSDNQNLNKTYKK